MIIQKLVDFSGGFIEVYLFFLLCETFMERRENCRKIIYPAGVVLAGILTDISATVLPVTLLNLIVIIVIQIAYSFLYKGSIKAHILLPMLNNAMATVTEIFVLFALSILYDVDVSALIAAGTMRMSGMILSKLLMYIVIKYICFRFKREAVGADISYWVLFAVLFGITMLTLFTFCKMLEENPSVYIRNLTMISILGLSAANVIILWLYENTFKQKSLITQKQLTEVRLKEQIKHYNDITAAQAQTRKLKHDLSNHIISIKSYVEDGKKDECLKYLDNLTDYANINSDIIDTGNSVIDAILTAKRNLARERNIDFSADIQIPADLKINSSDCCVIFGNALDNAIEACDKVQGNKYIKVSLVYQNGSLMCKIANSMNETKNPLLKTTKADKINHGIGLKNIRETLNKYSSMLRVEQNAGEFVLSFIIYEVK